MPAKFNIKSKEGRSALPVRREPYWERISQGCYVGYRQLKTGGVGSWIARYRDYDGKQHYRALGEFVSYDAAAKAAGQWFDLNRTGVISKGTTVKDACRMYVDYIRTKKSDATARDAEGRFSRLVYGKRLANIPLDRLAMHQVTAWTLGLVPNTSDEEEKRKAKVSANRNLATLKAALNYARSQGHVATDAAWATVEKFSDVDKGRTGMFLDIGQRQALLDACSSTEFRSFVEALLLTAARPGELVGVTARDFDRAVGTLAVKGKTGSRTVVLSGRALQLFTGLAAGKIGNALLLPRPDGLKWTKETWAKEFRAATRKAGLSDGFVIYSLRHTAISEMVMGDMPIFTVARNAGTSPEMIDENYGHLNPKHVREKLDAVRIL